MIIQPAASARPRRSRRHRRERVFLASCLAAAVGLALAVLIGISGAPLRSVAAPAVPSQVRIQQGELDTVRPARTVYRYSVVDGGAYTADELAAAIERDPIVANHYRSIKAEALRAETVSEDRLAYMSYRRGGQIFWTKHKVRLRQGETILTDGRTQVRSRCGNCISLEPMLPTAEDEPQAVEFEAATDDRSATPPPPISLETEMVPTGLLPPVALVPPYGDAPFDFVGPIPIGTLAENVDSEQVFPGELGEPEEPEPPVLPLDPEVGPIPVPPPTPPGRGTPPPSTTQPPPNNVPPVLVNIPPVVNPPIEVPEGFTPPNDFPVDPPVDPAPVPEPGTMLLIGSGAVGMIVRKLRRKGV